MLYIQALILQPHFMSLTDADGASGHNGSVAPAPDACVATATNAIHGHDCVSGVSPRAGGGALPAP